MCQVSSVIHSNGYFSMTKKKSNGRLMCRTTHVHDEVFVEHCSANICIPFRFVGGQ